MQLLFSKLSPKVRWRLATIVKKARNIFFHKLVKPSHNSGTRLILNIGKKANVALRSWSAKRAVVCLTHDVDTCEGYEYIPSLLTMEKKYGIRSAFYFLVQGDYPLDYRLLSLLEKEGFETGLHGGTHDILLAHRREDQIYSTVANSLAEGRLANCGFRSPALSMSVALLKVLSRLKLRYDSSIALDYRDWGCCFPYLFPDTQLWELPVCLQDDALFRELDLSEEEAFVLTMELVEDVKLVGGVGTMIFHPIFIKNNSHFYERLLSFLITQSDILIAKPSEVVNIMEKRARDV